MEDPREFEPVPKRPAFPGWCPGQRASPKWRHDLTQRWQESQICGLDAPIAAFSL